MTPKITDEMRKALHEHPGAPVTVEDDRTQKMYLLVEEGTFASLWDDYIRREVEKGLAAIDRGEVIDWDPEAIKAEGRRILAARSASA